MATHWHPERRRRFEQTLLDHCHQALLAGGVAGYDRAALGHDYRLAVLMQMMVPLWQCAAGAPAGIWWNNLERLLPATTR